MTLEEAVKALPDTPEAIEENRRRGDHGLRESFHSGATRRTVL